MKSFPHESRGWEIKNFDCVDPTDSYGSETQVYVNRNRILIIEPGFEIFTLNSWLSDKSRHVFDGAYQVSRKVDTQGLSIGGQMHIKILEKFYFLEHFFTPLQVSNFLTVVFGHVGLETLSLLRNFALRYSFANIKSTLGFNSAVDFETGFQLNSVTTWAKLKAVDKCLLIGTNSRLESFRLNLSLRKRMLKGGFSCLSFSSLIDLTFTTSFKNSSAMTLFSISEGTHLVCQELVESKNPLIVYNSELLKSFCSEALIKALQTLANLSIRGLEQNRLNMLNATLCEAGGYSLGGVEGFSFKDLFTSKVFYFAQSNLALDSCVKQASEMSLLNTLINNKRDDAVIIDQNYFCNNNIKVFLPRYSYDYLPASTFYENDEIYCNTEGLFKRTLRLFTSKGVLTTWQTLLAMLGYMSKHLKPLSLKSSHNLSYSTLGYSKFRVFIHLHDYVAQNLSSINFYLTAKTSAVHTSGIPFFKRPRIKIKNCKLKFWLEDFFTGGKDEYSRNSTVLNSCSNLIRSTIINF